MAIATLLASSCNLAPSASKQPINRPATQEAPAAEMKLLEPDFGILIINGREVDPTDYPALAYDFTRGRAPCSGTVIGPRVLVTAAHCLEPIPAVVVLGESFGDIEAIDCAISPHYRSNDPGYDIGLCFLERPLSGIAFESIHISPTTTVEAGTWVRLMGFGCNSLRSEGFNVLRSGDARISRVGDEAVGAPLEAIGTVAVCEGDSGGPVFLLEPSAGTPEVDTPRGGLVGVISQYGPTKGQSQFAALAAPRNAEFIREWAGRVGAEICGLSVSPAANCR